MSRRNLLAFNKPPIVLLLFIFVAAFLLYLCSRLFFYDEDIFVVNAHNKFMLDFTRAPIVKLSFLLDNFLYKAKPTGYHVTNVLFHLSNSILATYTFRELLRFGMPDRSKVRLSCYIFFFIFLLSPIHSESLCYILGRAGLVVTFFCIISLLLFLKANFNSYKLLLGSLLFFSAALYSYEISWTFALIILLTANYVRMQKSLSTRSFLIYTIPYFVVFIIWFLVQVVIINKYRVIPYGNDVFSSFQTLRLLKNAGVLFIRNIVPPFANTAAFVTVGSIAGLLICYILFILQSRHKPLLSLSILFVSVAFLAFIPCIAFGINSHNSESERYIYFSSVFVIMFVATAFSMLSDLKIIRSVAMILCCIYACCLFSTINNYIRGGNFSKKYLNILAKETRGFKYNYLINQPSQYKGALLFRAYGSSGASDRKLSTLQDFMHSLNKDKSADYLTLSKQELKDESSIDNVLYLSIDDLQSVFPDFHLNETKNMLINSSTLDSVKFEKGQSMILGLKLPSVYVFK